MPTDEFLPLLDRERAVSNATPLIEAACPLLREVVNHASMAFRRCTAASDNLGGENEDLAPFILYPRRPGSRVVARIHPSGPLRAAFAVVDVRVPPRADHQLRDARSHDPPRERVRADAGAGAVLRSSAVDPVRVGNARCGSPACGCSAWARADRGGIPANEATRQQPTEVVSTVRRSREPAAARQGRRPRMGIPGDVRRMVELQSRRRCFGVPPQRRSTRRDRVPRRPVATPDAAPRHDGRVRDAAFDPPYDRPLPPRRGPDGLVRARGPRSNACAAGVARHPSRRRRTAAQLMLCGIAAGAASSTGSGAAV